MNEKNKIEALLFAVAKRISIDDISKITGIRDIEKIKTALFELKTEYEAKGSSMVLRDEGDGFWKLTVQDYYLPIMQKVVSQTELDRPLMETLAVIAWKYPVLQADVVKIRHNKAYDHLKRLEELGFVTRIKFGRTNKLTLTTKFFEYFDLPSAEQAKEVFKNVVPAKVKEKVENTEKEIDEAESKLEEIKMKKREMEEEKKKEAKEKKELIGKEAIEAEIKEEKEELEKEQEKEDEEIEEMEKDISEIEKEEDKDVYSSVPEVQEQDEVSGNDTDSGRKE